jgi:hypothetical protein
MSGQRLGRKERDKWGVWRGSEKGREDSEAQRMRREKRFQSTGKPNSTCVWFSDAVPI